MVPIGGGSRVVSNFMFVEEPSMSYANSTGVSFSRFDFVLEFAQDIPAEGDTPEQVAVHRRPIARVALSPPQAVGLAELLNGDIEAYEKQYGTIPRPGPDEVVDAIGAEDPTP